MEKKTIGTFIAALRKANGITQQELADRLNISNKAVSRWERDECAPDITLIPALAEILGVTCDELLKGERIANDYQQEKSAPKVEKQIKALINRSISNYKTLIMISLALSLIGLIIMFGVTYWFLNVIAGFVAMCVFVISAFVTAAIGTMKLKEIKRDNSLFEVADEAQITRYNKTLGNFSFVAFFSAIAVVVLSLPLFYGFTNDYTVSIISFSHYLEIFGFLIPALGLLFIALKDILSRRITEQPYKRAAREKNVKLVLMNILQLGTIVLATVLFVISPYIKSGGASKALIVIGMYALPVINAAIFIIFMAVYKSDRKVLALSGLRNFLTVLPSIIVMLSHYDDIHYGLWDVALNGVRWNIRYLLIAFGTVLFIFMIFQAVKSVIRSRQN